MSKYQSVGVIGAGAWGTALAQTAASAGRSVTLWSFEQDVADAINDKHENTIYLPEVALDPTIMATTAMSDLDACDAILAVAPAQHLRRVLESFLPFAQPGVPIALCAKGIEQSSLSMMTDVLAETIPGAVPAVLSGPSFAIDTAKGLPTAVTLACADETVGADLVEALGTTRFRPYLANDLVGAEIGGAVKNVLAIACGISEGSGLGKSAHAALISRGFAEMTRLALALGAQRETLSGLCGLGDLVLTCSSPQSRNMSCGLALGRGVSLDDILSSRKAVTEGVASAPAVVALAKRHGIEMPICEAVETILKGEVSVEDAIETLLARPFTLETA
ncbi:MAG: NAD(P)H-dependent glycerol-3-phosphate dehydrogenase [Maricaulis sp.]|jgi:glycerol-3-phosphate dehydrogenase (NAD(P)+)|uniref:NAD(P)H-dependent glycerol-3-phosphate dehydrogenase n=1 Tax=Maricaulis sp. TaxID=1486257 RepID=UPI001B1613BE|nr:NAD(P)H-dependent glycerol-3-phosphate dehydrogenase [Maricaulis sp.]MBO6729226.1 NAD(P)-dependent glycerol-3-phosphate dehydrogenase [Maricaulis sp.]MBO6847598.1 NAD(P)-dependent glycerol-3-phosphate dehydrogenase [Maricaulis sp.]MBO6876975.1 NAD(P)-dependent glycerol-3-phosphate dehydrogenase [Maricaulis sp.]MDM7985265.1 NAD(P)H-dependent glycerol-3-phosphate dehydrogenase [Maricaulis sp.]